MTRFFAAVVRFVRRETNSFLDQYERLIDL